MPRAQFKHRYWFFADAPTIAENFRVIWKDLQYDGNIGEDVLHVQYICFKKVCDVKSVTQPDTVPLLENNYWIQMTEIGFAEQF
jgi:hypothetical protein